MSSFTNGKWYKVHKRVDGVLYVVKNEGGHVFMKNFKGHLKVKWKDGNFYGRNGKLIKNVPSDNYLRPSKNKFSYDDAVEALQHNKIYKIINDPGERNSYVYFKKQFIYLKGSTNEKKGKYVKTSKRPYFITPNGKKLMLSINIYSKKRNIIPKRSRKLSLTRKKLKRYSARPRRKSRTRKGSRSRTRSPRRRFSKR